jgi:D-ribose pyranose/furanose isomerase RbsD
MKKYGILNRKLNDALAALGHGDICMITDAGFPLPYDAQPGTISVDLAIAQDLPDIPTVLRLVNDEIIYEECYVATFQRDYNPVLHDAVKSVVKRCDVVPIEHEKIQDMGTRAKVIIRTGGFSPWGNIALVSGIKAPVWFAKPDVVTPDFYKERVAYVDKDVPWHDE